MNQLYNYIAQLLHIHSHDWFFDNFNNTIMLYEPWWKFMQKKLNKKQLKEMLAALHKRFKSQYVNLINTENNSSVMFIWNDYEDTYITYLPDNNNVKPLRLKPVNYN